MDSYREHPSDFDLQCASEAPPSHDVAAAIGTDERRMHVRAYNYWVSLLDGRDFPSIEDLDPGDVRDFSANSILLDFTCGGENPAIPYIGASIRDECGLDDDTRTIAEVPSRSLLSRLTDHYMQIIANRAPIGFEAEFANQRDETICYRGILMPFSSDGDTIDFIYGVINWKTVGERAAEEAAGSYHVPDVPHAVSEEEEAAQLDEISVAPDEPLQPETEDEALELTDVAEAPPVDDFHQHQEDTGIQSDAPEASDASQPPVHFSWEDGPLHDDDSVELPEVALDADAGLADRLWAARETAEAVKAGEGRTRAALYRALSLAYDFAIAAQQSPEEFAELLEESGVKAQLRAPMTPIVKLVFGIDYDKARLTEFAAALSFANRQEIALGEFQQFIEKQAGGLKALVAAERQARRPEPRTDTRIEAARAKLRTVPTILLAEVPVQQEFALVVTRRGPDGRHEAIAVIEDEALLDRALRRAV